MIAILLGAIAAYTYLHFQRDKPVATFLKDKLWDFLIVFMLVTRVSVLILHPSLLWNFNIYYVLAQPPAEGWLVGLAAAVIIVGRSWRRGQVDNRIALFQLAQAVLWGSVPYFLYGLLREAAPYRWLDAARLTGAVVIAAAVRFTRLRAAGERYPQRFWLVIGLGLLVSSLTVPRLNLLGPFTTGQWAELALCMAALMIEANIK